MCLTILLGLVVEIFERRSFDIEVSSFLAFPANGRSRAHRQRLSISDDDLRYLSPFSRCSMAPGMGS